MFYPKVQVLISLTASLVLLWCKSCSAQLGSSVEGGVVARSCTLQGSVAVEVALKESLRGCSRTAVGEGSCVELSRASGY